MEYPKMCFCVISYYIASMCMYYVVYMLNSFAYTGTSLSYIQRSSWLVCFISYVVILSFSCVWGMWNAMIDNKLQSEDITRDIVVQRRGRVNDIPWLIASNPYTLWCIRLFSNRSVDITFISKLYWLYIKLYKYILSNSLIFDNNILLMAFNTFQFTKIQWIWPLYQSCISYISNYINISCQIVWYLTTTFYLWHSINSNLQNNTLVFMGGGGYSLLNPIFNNEITIQCFGSE